MSFCQFFSSSCHSPSFRLCLAPLRRKKKLQMPFKKFFFYNFFDKSQYSSLSSTPCARSLFPPSASPEFSLSIMTPQILNSLILPAAAILTTPRLQSLLLRASKHIFCSRTSLPPPCPSLQKFVALFFFFPFAVPVPLLYKIKRIHFLLAYRFWVCVCFCCFFGWFWRKA